MHGDRLIDVQLFSRAHVLILGFCYDTIITTTLRNIILYMSIKHDLKCNGMARIKIIAFIINLPTFKVEILFCLF